MISVISMLKRILTLSLTKGEGARPSYFDKLSMRASEVEEAIR